MALPFSEPGMRLRLVSTLLVLASFTPLLLARQKAPTPLPPWLLQARTVAVLIDPAAGVSPDDPNANQVAQKDVETALSNWGRFQPVLSTANADLLIVIRRGHGHLAEPTVTDPRGNHRPGSVTPSASGVSVGVQHGTPPFDSTRADDNSRGDSPRIHEEIGGADDSFAVYRGSASGDNPQPLDSAPAWHVLAKDALKPHSVPAVERFRRAVAEADKAAAQAKP